MDKEFFVVTDASDYAVGACLMQQYDGVLRPVEFWSKMFSGAEQKWHTAEKEMVAIVWALEHWEPYLLHRKFHVYTDHKNLQELFNKVKDFRNGKLYSWAIRLQEYDFTAKWLAGTENIIAENSIVSTMDS